MRSCKGYDTRSPKSLDVFSVHGFPVGLIQAESNLLGIQHPGTGRNVGSGGWSNVVEKLARAKEYCEAPFEVRYDGRSKRTVPVARLVGDDLARAGAAMAELASWEEVRERLEAEGPLASRSADTVAEEREEYGVCDVEIAF